MQILTTKKIGHFHLASTFGSVIFFLVVVHLCVTLVVAQDPTSQTSPSRSVVDFAALCTGQLTPLKPGQAYPAQITAGQKQCWTIKLPARHYMHIEVRQQGIDVVVQLFDRTHRVPITEEIDSP